MPNPDSGLYHKYKISRMDNKDSAGGPHENCSYFVLDLSHDPYAKAAILAYAEACRVELPLLAADLDWAAANFEFQKDSEGSAT